MARTIRNTAYRKNRDRNGLRATANRKTHTTKTSKTTTQWMREAAS